MKQAIYVLIFLAVLLCVEAVYLILRDVKRRRGRFVRQRLAAPAAAPTGLDRGALLRKAPRRGWSALALTARVRELPGLARLPGLMRAADIHLDLDQFLVYSGGCGLALGAAVGVLTRRMDAALAAAAVGAIVPLLLVLRRRRRRQRQIQQQFPEVIDLIVRSLRVGHALTGTFKVVADEFGEPLAPEFRRVYEEHNLGIPLRDALEAMQQRLGNLDVRFFVTSVNLQRETGGNLTEILEGLSRTIRNRVRLQGQVSAKTAEGRMAGWVLAAMPILVMVLIAAMNPDYTRMLFHDPRGQTLLKVAAALIVTGVLLIKKIVTVRV